MPPNGHTSPVPTWIEWARAMRANQWTKNAVVAAAFFFALGDRDQHLSIVPALAHAGLAVVAFCLVSSGIYVFNDLRDRDADRLHPDKRNRPIAAGRIHPAAAAVLSAALSAAGMGLARFVSPSLAVLAGAYVCLQLLYSLWLKRIPLLDILLIAVGFVLRAAAGGAALGVTISPWLLLCAFLLALFLAACKRRHEKSDVGDGANGQRDVLQAYDLRVLDQLVAVTAAATIVAYSMYTLSDATVAKFRTHGMGLTIPFVVFGIFRYMDLLYRQRRGDRPDRVVLTDPPTLVNLALYGAAVLAVFFC